MSAEPGVASLLKQRDHQTNIRPGDTNHVLHAAPNPCFGTMSSSYYAFVAISVILTASMAASAERPNILILFTDNQGYADLACYGNTKNRTPRLDQLAREGTRFTSFYSQTVCGPSRSALLTGRQPIRSGGWSMPAGEITFAELMREAGYQTACIGKWDVSNRKAIVDRMPNAQAGL